jgi:hypothetical protein
MLVGCPLISPSWTLQAVCAYSVSVGTKLAARALDGATIAKWQPSRHRKIDTINAGGKFLRFDLSAIIGPSFSTARFLVV